MDKEITTLEDAEIEKTKFKYSKHPVDISNVDIDKIIISKRFLLVKSVSITLLVTKTREKLSFMYNPSKNEWIYKNL